MRLGLDFGQTNLDGVLIDGERIVYTWQQDTTVPASQTELQDLLEAHVLEVNGLRFADLEWIGTTGGRHRELPSVVNGVPVHPVGEAQAVGRGGLVMAKLDQALVVSAGTGTAMISSRMTSGEDSTFTHVTGSAVGGGTLLGLSKLLLGTTDPFEIARLAALGDPAGVDSTLQDVIGGGIGHLPSDATAVNLGRLGKLETAPRREDLAAGLVTLVSQVIAVIALNAAKANHLEKIVIVGHLADLDPVRAALIRVWGFYGVTPDPIVPAQRGFATALGAALEAEASRLPC
jgi:type II pantothenate kinase